MKCFNCSRPNVCTCVKILFHRKCQSCLALFWLRTKTDLDVASSMKEKKKKEKALSRKSLPVSNLLGKLVFLSMLGFSLKLHYSTSTSASHVNGRLTSSERRLHYGTSAPYHLALSKCAVQAQYWVLGYQHFGILELGSSKLRQR